MGKDKKQKSLIDHIHVSKDKLKSENLRLALQLKTLESQYKDIHIVFQQLDREYQDSKGSFPIQRYGQLKEMIKRATSEEILQKAHAHVQKEEASTKKSGIGGLVDRCKQMASSANDTPTTEANSKGGNISGLLQACKTFSGAADDIETKAEIKKDLDQMTKQEVSRDNEIKQYEIEKFPTKFLRAYNRLEKLKRDYEVAKEHFILTRYRDMKTMVKTVTDDKTL